MSRKNKIPANAWHFSSTKTDSTDFKNENFTEKIKKKQGRETMSFLKNIPKDLETDETIK